MACTPRRQELETHGIAKEKELHNFDSGGGGATLFLPAAADFGLRGHGEGREELGAPRAFFHHPQEKVHGGFGRGCHQLRPGHLPFRLVWVHSLTL
jgi:hypothetical protein